MKSIDHPSGGDFQSLLFQLAGKPENVAQKLSAE
jgi:hypothetical protein